MDIKKLKELKEKLYKKQDGGIEENDNTKKEMLDKLIQDYNKSKEDFAERQNVADWSTAASSLASTLDKYSPTPVGVQAQKFSAGETPNINEIVKLSDSIERGEDDPLIDLKKQKLEAQIGEIGKEDPLSDLRRKKMLAEIDRMSKDTKDPNADLKRQKLQAQIDKLNRDTTKGSKKPKNKFEEELDKVNAKDYAKAQTQAKSAVANDAMIDDALDSFLTYSDKNLGGTGPLATGFGAKALFDDETANLQAKLGSVAFDKMTKMFAGMSKAIDSDAERAAFEKIQPNIKNDDLTNASILLGAKAVNLRNIAEAKAQAKHLETNDNLRDYTSPVMDNPTTVLVSPTGEMVLISRDKSEEYESQGFATLDQRARQLVGGTTKSFTEAQERGIQKFMDKNNLDRQKAIEVLMKNGRL